MDKISESLNAATAMDYPKFLDEERKEITEFADKYKELSNNLSTDYDFARDNLRKLITCAMDIIPNAMALAKEAENARLYESTGSFIKTIAEINKDLLDITERNLKPPINRNLQADNKSTTSITNNAIFMGTTDELFNHILNANKLIANEKEPIIIN